ncbi:REP-associated tyrosine transposase [Pelotomaculum propionicicum]|uniref:REP-associated tyrosine transposase n=1 Tax=Pelotomaculum propionicicum TaxID=258475 RepID=UPI003B76E523
MPRQMRKLSESKIYHVMIRGNEKKDIFLDDEDREELLYIIREKNKEKKWNIYAYCLMNNHVHLLINEGVDEIARIMQRINISYAHYFNKKYKRVGHLLQDRYRSENIEDNSYMLACVRYIHNNPVKAGIVKDAALYRWSSLNPYLDKGYRDPVGLDRSTVLGMFSENENQAAKMFLEFNKMASDDVFADYTDEEAEISLINADAFIEGFLNDYGLTRDTLKIRQNSTLRNKLIQELTSRSNLSLRQIAGLLEIDRGVVQRRAAGLK